jgi:hypothetical protein
VPGYAERSVAQIPLDRSIDTADDTSRRKPSTAFLILLNALVFLALLLPGLNPIGWIKAPAAGCSETIWNANHTMPLFTLVLMNQGTRGSSSTAAIS